MRLRDRAGEDIVEACVPWSPRGAVPGAPWAQERPSKDAVELVERVERARLRAAREAEAERCADGDAPAPDDEVTPTEPLHGRSLGWMEGRGYRSMER